LERHRAGRADGSGPRLASAPYPSISNQFVTLARLGVRKLASALYCASPCDRREEVARRVFLGRAMVAGGTEVPRAKAGASSRTPRCQWSATASSNWLSPARHKAYFSRYPERMEAAPASPRVLRARTQTSPDLFAGSVFAMCSRSSMHASCGDAPRAMLCTIETLV